MVPPFQTITRPALGVSQLKANLQEHGFETDILYLNFLFAERIGLDAYEWISESTMDVLLGEFIFSDAIYQRTDRQIEKYVRNVLAGSDDSSVLAELFPAQDACQTLRRLMREASEFSRTDGLEAILGRRPWMVGLTSSFQQNCSSLSLIQQVKKARPDVVTVMGGPIVSRRWAKSCSDSFQISITSDRVSATRRS